MTKIRLKYIHAFKDRHGYVRHYLRRNGKRWPLEGLPGSTEFMVSYATALADSNAPRAIEPIGSSRTTPRSVGAAVVGYLGSHQYGRLSQISRVHYRRDLEKLRIEHGDKRLAGLKRRHVREQMELAGSPSRAIARLNAIKIVVRYALDRDWIETDPTAGIRAPRLEGDGYKAWSEDDIAAFEARHAVGTRARLAFALALYTGQRRADIIRMGRSDIQNGTIAVCQQKTGARLVLPVHPTLARVIAETPVVGLTTLLTKDNGKPWTPGNFSTWFAARVAEAGLSGVSVHGLRKAAARRLAEAGCTPHEIGSVTGHATLAEIERYTKSASQERMAQVAMTKIGRVE